MSGRTGQIAEALKGLASVVEAGTAQNNTMLQQFGWNFPPLTRKNLAQMASGLARKIGSIPDEKVKESFDAGPIIEQIESFKTSVVAYFWNGNGNAAVPGYLALLDWIERTFDPVFEAKVDWEKLHDNGLLPKQLSAKLRSHKAAIGRFDVDISELEKKVAYINQAHDAALELPTDLEALRSATEEVATMKSTSERNEILASAALKKIEAHVAFIEEKRLEAMRLVENTEDAYSAATTKGLGETFQKRADRLARSMWTWVVGLTAALVLGGVVGTYRVDVLQKLISSDASSGVISLNLLLAFITVAAPVWFAWIATKQIGHRFRLAEDYAFKASVAQAYEGYRRAAARVDESFAKRLFSTALDRIEEAPIRFVESETYGSPWHEFVRLRRRSDAKEAVTVEEVATKTVAPKKESLSQSPRSSRLSEPNRVE